MSRQLKTRQPVSRTIFLLGKPNSSRNQNSFPSGCKRYWRLAYIFLILIEGVLGPLGIITPTEEGNFEGFLSMGVRDNVRVLKNTVKTPKSKEPDYRIIGDKLGECGAGWNKVGQTSGKPFISITLEHPNISDRKVYASTGLVKGSKDKSLAMIWNPEN